MLKIMLRCLFAVGLLGLLLWSGATAQGPAGGMPPRMGAKNESSGSGRGIIDADSSFDRMLQSYGGSGDVLDYARIAAETRERNNRFYQMAGEPPMPTSGTITREQYRAGFKKRVERVQAQFDNRSGRGGAELGGFDGPGVPSDTVWTYRFEKPEENLGFKRLLVALGREGWEYVGPVPSSEEFVFKRKVQSQSGSTFPGGLPPRLPGGDPRDATSSPDGARTGSTRSSSVGTVKPSTPKSETRSIEMKYLRANEAERVARALFPQLNLSAVEALNSLVVRGTDSDILELMMLIKELDMAASKNLKSFDAPPPAPKKP
jgi:hypothetical protein